MSPTTDLLTLDVLQANVSLLAEKERLEREQTRLLELDRLRTEFLARVSHDLRTPLASIIGFAELLQSDSHLMAGEQNDYVEAIYRNSQSLLALINDLLDLSSLELGRLPLHPAPVLLTELLADLRAATQPVLAQAGLTISWPDATLLAGRNAVLDRRRMFQVLVNLVDNARKFTPRGGHVVITLEPQDEDLVFTIADTGPGISEAQRDKLFRPYAHRLDSVPRSEGVGLGLAIVKAIVDRHGGSITLDRRSSGGSLGSGCTFLIRIPQVIPTGPA